MSTAAAHRRLNRRGVRVPHSGADPERRVVVEEADLHGIRGVAALDRLARKAIHQGLIFTEAEHAGVAVELATEKVEDTPEGRLMLAVKGFQAEYERAKIVDRTMGGKRAKVRSGKPLGSGFPPFGLRFTADKGGTKRTRQPSATCAGCSTPKSPRSTPR